MSCTGQLSAYGSFWTKMSSVKSFQMQNFFSEAPCKNMTEAESLNIDKCCKMSEDLNQFLPQIFTVMKYAQQAPHAVEEQDDFLASFKNTSFLSYPTKTFEQSRLVKNPAIPMCQYAGNVKIVHQCIALKVLTCYTV